MTLTLTKYKGDIVTLFFLAALACGALEYVTSYVMEKLFNARWWDYSNRRFNINGRVCLETLVPFGIVGVLVINYLNPFFIGLLDKIPNGVRLGLCIGISVIFITDIILSFTVISRLKKTVKDFDLSDDDDTEKISNYVKDQTENMAIQLESDVRRNTRKRRLKRQRSILHMKLRTTKKLQKSYDEAVAKSEKLRSDITEKIESAKFSANEKIESVKLSADEYTAKIKSMFSDKSFLNKRLIKAFPNIQFTNLKEKLNKKEEK